MPYSVRNLSREVWAKIDRHGHVIFETTRQGILSACAHVARKHMNRLIVNANPLRVDPTRTGMIRRQFEADLKRRLRKLRNAVWEFIVVKDALALKERTSLITMAQEREFEFKSDPGKLEAFNDWFKKQAEADLISAAPGGDPSKPWTAKYIESAFKRGQANAFASSRQGEFFESIGVGDLTQERFIQQAFNQPESASKVKLLATRSFEDLKGISSSMSSKMNQILAQGMIDGKGAEAIANEMFDKMKSLGESRALTIARTEVVRAHAEGQLDAFDDLGVDELGVKAEWSTAGDDRVCPECEEMEGKTFTVDEARGLIPLHPNCRCTWVPALPEKEKKERREKKSRRDLESVKGAPEELREAWNKARRDLSAAKKAGVTGAELDRLKEIEKAAKREVFKAGRIADKNKPLPPPAPKPTPTPEPVPVEKPRDIFGEGGVDAANKFGKELHAGQVITDEMRKAVVDYTGADYEKINGFLRQGVAATEETKKQIAALDKLLEQTPKTKEAITLYRAATIDTSLLAPGSIIQDAGFASSSMNPETAAFFGLRKGTTRILINVPRGSTMAALNEVGQKSLMTSEVEMLLPRNSKFRVTGQKVIRTIAGKEVEFVVVDLIPPGATPPPLPITAPKKITKFNTAKEYREALTSTMQSSELQKAYVDAAANYTRTRDAYVRASDARAPNTAELKAKYDAAAVTREKALKALDEDVKNRIRETLVEKDNLANAINFKPSNFSVGHASNRDTYEKPMKDILAMMPKDKFTKQEIADLSNVSVQLKKHLGGASGTYNQYGKTIKIVDLPTDAASRVTAHEFGHHVSYQVKNIYERQQDFFDLRTKGEEVKPLWGYSKDIVGKKDKWGSVDDVNTVYAGRVYSSFGDRTPEVISVGIEQLWKDPMRFAKNDPEWFDMIVGALKQIPTK